jgi:capsular exopolysaccharide synthesis family protein
MAVQQQLAIVRRWLWLIVGSVLLAGSAAYYVSTTLPKVYEAKAALIVGQFLSAANPDSGQIATSQRLSQSYAEVAATRPILEGVVRKLSVPMSPDALLGRVQVVALRDSTLIRITAQDEDPNRAAAIANAMADELIAASPTIQGRQTEIEKLVTQQIEATQRQIEDAQVEEARLSALWSPTPEQAQRLDSLGQRLVSLRSTLATLLTSTSTTASNSLSVAESALPPGVPSSPRVLLNTILAALVGLLIAFGVAFLFEHLDDTLKSAVDIEAVAGLPTLGAVIKMKGGKGRSEMYRLATILYPRSPAAEAYRTLRTNIEFASVDAPTRTLVVTSPSQGEGKTTTVANLAVAFAQAGKRTLVLDTDLRRPGIHRIFDLPNAHGLTSLLRADDVSVTALVHGTEQDGLQVLTSGPLPPNPAELLGSQRFRAVLKRLADEFEVVILDSPPVQAVADAAILASMTDGTLYVVEAGRTRRGHARHGREALAKADARVLGSVLNRVPERTLGEYYYHYYGGYGEHDGSVMTQPSPRKGSAG